MPETPRTWTLVREGEYVEGRVFTGPVTDGSQSVLVVEKALVDAERERLLDLLEEIATSGIGFEDDRLRYLDVQIDRSDWEQLLALLREYGRLGKEES